MFKSFNPFLFGWSFLQMFNIKAKALFMRFYVLSMKFVSMCLNIVLSHAFSECALSRFYIRNIRYV